MQKHKSRKGNAEVTAKRVAAQGTIRQASPKRQAQLSEEQLDKVVGGMSDILVTKRTDKSSSKLP